MEKFRKVLDFCLRHQKVLGYGAVSLLTTGIEQIFSVVAFECPCNSWNLLYGSVFLLIPALFLLLLSLIVNTRSWMVLLTGCCCAPDSRGCRNEGHFGRYLHMLCAEVARAAVAPLTWIAVALLGAHYYECAASGNTRIQRSMCKNQEHLEFNECINLTITVPCDTSPQKADMRKGLQAQSQVLGWILISSVMTLTVIFTCISRCCSPVRALHLKFWKTYVEKEKELFKVKAQEHTTRLAERNLKCFFDSTKMEPFHTPSTEDWQEVSSLFVLNPKENGDCYSMIHKYVNSKSGNTGSAEEHVSPAFVDAARSPEASVTV